MARTHHASVEALDQLIHEAFKKSNPHVTDAGKCDRKVYLSLVGQEPTNPLTVDSMVNFGVGHAVEEWLAQVLAEQGITVYREVRVEIPIHDTVVTGRIDFAFVASGRLIELKTISSRAMAAMLRTGEAGRDEHRRQINLYKYSSEYGTLTSGGVPLQGEFNELFLIYITKDATAREPSINAWRVEYDPAQALEDLNHLAELHGLAKRGMDPGIPHEYLKNFHTSKTHDPGWQCRGAYCQFAAHCWRLNENGWPIAPKEAE